jgi:hypothetical protein
LVTNILSAYGLVDAKSRKNNSGPLGKKSKSKWGFKKPTDGPARANS